MNSYTTTFRTTASTEQVLAVLTDPDAIRTWSPVPFEIDGGERGTLRTGTEARVSGSLAGINVGFDVRVHEAGDDGLRLSADGPMSIDVDYGLRPIADGSEVSARVSVGRSRGMTSRLVTRAAQAMLAAGALDGATGRIAEAAEGMHPRAAGLEAMAA
jgi:hypothetical protein